MVLFLVFPCPPVDDYLVSYYIGKMHSLLWWGHFPFGISQGIFSGLSNSYQGNFQIFWVSLYFIVNKTYSLPTVQTHFPGSMISNMNSKHFFD